MTKTARPFTIKSNLFPFRLTVTCDGLVGVSDGPAAGGVGLVRGCGVRVDATVRPAIGRSGVTEKGVRVGLEEALGKIVEVGEGAANGMSVPAGEATTEPVAVRVTVDAGDASSKGEGLWVASATRVGAAGAQLGDASTTAKTSHPNARENGFKWTPA